MNDRPTASTINDAQLDALYRERDTLRASVLDIDAHATPIGLADPNDPDGNPHHYVVTVGALHRALGKVGHTAASCTAEAEVARLRAGEEGGCDPAALPTPGQWMKRYNDATAEQRHEIVTRLVTAADHGHACMMRMHEVHIRDGHEAEATVRRVRALIAGRWGKVDPDLVRAALDGTEPPTEGRLIAGPDELRERAEADPRAVAVAEATRQMDADPTQPHTGLVIQPYTEHGLDRWVFRCWGTDTCDGWLGLGHYTQQSAERERDRHLAEEHCECGGTLPHPDCPVRSPTTEPTTEQH